MRRPSPSVALHGITSSSFTSFDVYWARVRQFLCGQATQAARRRNRRVLGQAEVTGASYTSSSVSS